MRFDKLRPPPRKLEISAHIGRVLFGLAILAFGVEYSMFGHLEAGLPPLPLWLPEGRVLAYVMGTLLLIAALELLAGWRVHTTSLLLGVVLLVGAGLHLRDLSDVVYKGTARTGFLQPLALAAACFVLHALYSRGGRALPLIFGQMLFAATMIMFGIQHFMYPDTVSLVPRWLPNQEFWVLFFGGAMIAAGFALLTGWGARLASFGLALMFFLWLAALHIPRIVDKPYAIDLWTSGFIVLALVGASLVMAAGTRPAAPDPTYAAVTVG